MRVRGWMLAAVMMAAGTAGATTIPHLDEYAKNATSTTNVDLDKNMLGLAGNFMDQKKSDQAQAKKIVGKLQDIHVHSFEYDRDWAYDRKSVEDARKLFSGGDWSHIVSVHETGKGKSDEDTDIYMHVVNGSVAGMMIITAEPRELTFVEINGQLSMDDLKDLQGKFGIPAQSKKMDDPVKDDSAPPVPELASHALAPGEKPQDPRAALNYSGHPSPQP
jgi:Domain of unknown function (DUF4252)